VLKPKKWGVNALFYTKFHFRTVAKKREQIPVLP